jgi:uncharacterized protein YdgA (DUF945 family)
LAAPAGKGIIPGLDNYFSPGLIMKKIIWLPVAVVVLVAAWLGASWYTGQRIQAAINERIPLLNQIWAASGTPEQRLQIKQISYQRGLLSSHARYALSLNMLPDEQAPLIDLTIWHGPFAGGLAPKKFALHAELVNAGIVKTISDAAMSGKTPLVVDAVCAYGGHCTGASAMPAINYAPIPQFKLAFGGVQMQFDINWRSETDHQGSSRTQFLPLTINDQSFGSGAIVANSTAQSVNETLSWKTEKGESKLTLAMNTTRPVSIEEFKTVVKPVDILNFMGGIIKTGSVKLSLSKPMLVDMGARALNLTSRLDLAAAQQQVSQQLDEALTRDPRTQEFVQAQGDAIVSDWQYADGKLTINGQEKPEVLAEITQALKTAMQQAQRDQAASGQN